MIGDSNNSTLTGVIVDEVKISEKNGKTFGRFTLLNTFQLSEKSPKIEGYFQVFCMAENHVDLCKNELQTGDSVLIVGVISQDTNSGKTYVSFLPTSIVKITASTSPKKSPHIADDDLPF
jgi:hypothetical protein